MRKLLHLTSLSLVYFILSANYTFAQQLSIKNFAIFGGDNNASLIDSLTAGVEFASNISVQGGGSVGSQSFVQFKNQVNIGGDVYGNIVYIGNSFTLNGSLSVFNKQNLTYNTLNEGGLAQFLSPGNISTNGSSVIASGTVNGLLTHPAAYTYSGPAPGLGTNIAVPVFPTLPVMPDTATFPLAGATNITTTQTITPGVYGTLNLPTNQTITFSGPGTYVFASANGNFDTLRYDFKNTTTGVIRIYIIGDADLGAVQVDMVNGGSDSRIYTEIHGSGTPTNQFTSFAINTTGTFSSTWAGTVLARNGAIKIGNTNVGSINVVNGCMWSSRKVTIGINTSFNFVPLSSSADPVPNTTILPYYPPPADGKTNTLIGSELTSLFENPITKDSIIYRISGTSVYIEAISKQGQYDNTKAFLLADGLTDTISNGQGSLIITGKFPISNLLLLNARADLIDYARPLYYPINNSGIVSTRGDTAISSNLVRTGYNLTGEGVKVGVISDSYNTIPGDYAGIDVSNGDLPGPGNPSNNLTPVEVVKEYPFGQSIDEGRAMLQIVHDIAPKAQLAFRTGFISAGDFAQGIRDLDTAGCKVIVDDITYVTEPYFTDGVVANAVNTVVANGATYFSAAGNFGAQSYEGTFTSIPAPASVHGITGYVHDFGGGNPFQTLNLTPGNYTIVLQWQDNIYSLGTPNTGTQTDLDIFLTDNTGATLFGFNRNNMGTDPLEVLPFTVTANTTANLIIGNASSVSSNVKFKYIVFRGTVVFNNYGGSSTLVGQANSTGAIAVGAVLYKNTPPYGLPVPTIASFSSVGGTAVDGAPRYKPDLTAPNGVNTTVAFGNDPRQNIDGDAFPNFFGTSAAAPHVAAAAALLIEGKKKFLDETITPAALRSLLQSTALPMVDPGYTTDYDYASGHGFVQPFAAMQTFASPIPQIDSLVTANPVTRPVTTAFTVTVKGKGLTPITQIFLRGAAIPTRFVDNQTVTAEILPFTDNPAVQLYNPSIIPAANQTSFIDGGFSNSVFFFATQKQIIVTADAKAKKYGEKIPSFTSTITVDGVLIANTTLTPANLKLDHLTYTTPATTSSNVANYFIHPVNPLNPADPADALLLTQYNYVFVDGVLTINKLPLKITPRDTTLNYGRRVHGINFNYAVTPTGILQNPDSLINAIHFSHTSLIVDSILALVNGSGATSRALVNNDLINLSIMISSGSGATSRALVNNGSGTTITSYIVDVDVNSIFNYESNPASSPLINGSGATSRALVNTGPLINGTASVTNGSGATSRALVNGDPTLLNSNTTGGTSNTNVAVIVSSTDVPSLTNNIIITKPVNMLTNGLAIGVHTIVPAAFISGNFEITYGLGKLTINKAPLTITANTAYTDNGVLPPYTSTITGFQYQDAAIPHTGPVYTLSPAYSNKAGVYTIKPSAFTFSGDSNYTKSYINGTLYVNPFNNGKRVLINVTCVEKLKTPVSGFSYIAHFTAQNNNATSFYVPLGANNYFTSSGKYSGTPPVLFPKGTTKFNIYFDGKALTWTLKTVEVKTRCTQTAVASSSTCKCTGTLSLSAPDIRISDVTETTTTELFPNPATNAIMVTSSIDFSSAKDITVFDIYGRTMPVILAIKSSRNVELNISMLAKGTYFIRLIQGEKNKMIPFIKL